MNTTQGGTFGLGPVDQIGYVVGNLDRVLPLYEAMYGPFTVMEYPLEGLTYRDKTVDCRLKIATNQAGPVEIEIIQPVEGDTPYGEYLRRGGDGIHHVRFRVDDLDAKQSELCAAGFLTLFGKRFGPKLAFVYLEAPPDLGSPVIELFESGG